jgi:hypothetical protein
MKFSKNVRVAILSLRVQMVLGFIARVRGAGGGGHCGQPATQNYVEKNAANLCFKCRRAKSLLSGI